MKCIRNEYFPNSVFELDCMPRTAGSIWNLRLLGSIWFGGMIFSLSIFQYDELQ